MEKVLKMWQKVNLGKESKQFQLQKYVMQPSASVQLICLVILTMPFKLTFNPGCFLTIWKTFPSFPPIKSRDRLKNHPCHKEANLTAAKCRGGEEGARNPLPVWFPTVIYLYHVCGSCYWGILRLLLFN